MSNTYFKILAIDDNNDNLITLNALIGEYFPYAEVFTALDGSKGIEIAAVSEPDVILLDVIMPNMDGFQVCKKLKAFKRTTDIPVVFITAIKMDKESRIKALEAGGDGFLNKPVDESELVAQIRAMVKIRRSLIQKKDEKKILESVVEERTLELQNTHKETLKLLQHFKEENEKRKKSEEALKKSEEQIRLMMEDLLEAKEKAEESDRLKSAFLANMSHEIRTPMNGIMGFAELLKAPNLATDEQQKYISIIEKSGIRMLNIINNIVDISKIEAGSTDTTIVESNINEQIEFIYTFFKPEVEAKGMSFDYKISLPFKEANVLTDREKLYAILTNLVKNAIKYSEDGAIEFGYVTNACLSGLPDTLTFFVKDTGIGIRKEMFDIIFDRFRQVGEGSNRNYEGVGLGLSITKAYVEMLGGKIWVESEEEVGSCFFFTLPYTTKLDIKSVEQIENESDAQSTYSINTQNDVNIPRITILIAEDDETSEYLITKTVQKICKTLLVAHTGTEAVEICRNNPTIDLILMDIRMPEMDGHEATRQIRAFNKKVIIIAQTAYGLSSDKIKSMEAGCNEHISKPINKADIQTLIQRYFNSELSGVLADKAY